MVKLPINKIISGDCIDIMVEWPERSVDLILTDPPYNISSDSKVTKSFGRMLSTKEVWGDKFKDDYSEKEYLLFMEDLARTFDRVLKDDGSILMFFDRGKPYYLIPFYRRFFFRNMIAFIKRNPVPHTRKNNYRSGFELCAWFSRQKYKINFINQQKMINVFYGVIGRSSSGDSLLRSKNLRRTEHPTEKYEWMISPLIERHSNEGDLVVDPMCGSGTVPYCAKRLRRNYIGIDIKPEWCEVSRRRLDFITPTPLDRYVFI